MVLVDFMDGISRRLRVRNDASRLPDNARKLKIDFEPRITPDPSFDPGALTTLLKTASTNFQEVAINGIDDPLSPEDLGLLTTAISNSESLVINYWYSEVAYSCLGSCLSQVDGVKEIGIAMSPHELSNNQAGLFFEAVKSSSCIERLRLSTHFENFQYAGNALLEALQINRSLQALSIYGLRFETETILPSIFQAAILDAEVQSLSIAADDDFPFHHVPWNVWTNVLCREDCSLKTLHLSDDIDIIGPHDNHAISNSDSKRNTSVTHFTFVQTNFDMTRIMKICTVFQSLVSLNISSNNISDLSPLDPLLIGRHGLTLQNLYLADNTSLSQEYLSEFFRKLPQMTCIRHINLRANFHLLCESDEWMGVLEDAIWRNKSLEFLGFDDIRDNYSSYYSRIDVALAWNRAGLPRIRTLTENLLPLVLERATNLSYCKSNSNRIRSISEDVVFGLLQEMVSFSLLGR